MLKKIIILIIALALIIGGIVLFLYKPGQTTAPEGESVDVGNFFPSGDGTNRGPTTSPTDGTGENTDGVIPSSSLPVLRKISENPTSGAGVSTLKSGDVLRFIDKATGHIFETPTRTFLTSKISNTTIPKIYESYWSENGTGLILRYLKEDRETIESFYAKLKSATTTNTQDGPSPQSLEGTFLPQNIKGFAVSPQKTNIFYITNTADGSIGTVSNPDGSKRSEIFKSPLKEWLVSWPAADIIALATKPSFSSRGILYLLNRKTLSLEKTLVANGLTALVSPDASKVLYTENFGGLTSSFIFDVKTKTSAPFALQTLADKCVWSRTEKVTLYCAVPNGSLVGNLPDEWYSGETGFSDDIWKVEMNTGVTTRLASPATSANTTIDGVNLFTTDTEDFLFLTNKKDDSLWSVRLQTENEN